jgi:adenosine deaminase
MRSLPQKLIGRVVSAFLLSTAIHSASAQQPARHAPASVDSESRASHAFEEAARSGSPALYAFLLRFPKGADLHVHLSGAIYAETFIREAAEDGLCVDTTGLRFVHPPCGDNAVPASRLSGQLAPSDQDLYDRLVNSFSMRSFVPTPGYSGHDQFFSTFGKFGVDKRHTGEWVDEVASRAATQNQQYLELMQTPPFSRAATLSKQIGWPATSENVDFAAMRQALLDHDLRDEVKTGMEDVQSAEANRKRLEHCDTPQAAPACSVEIRYIYQVLRANPPEVVFAQTLLGFETIAQTMHDNEPGFLGINFVQPEDGYVSMHDYTLQMKMVDYLHSVYPQVHISLHAGELALGLVPPEGLRFHIRQAVEFGHAERIGHGVDVGNEDDAPALLKELAAKHVMIEINLSSNEGILGVRGADHPFPLYRASHVPVALSTDDEGVSRIDITHEYVRAALDYHLSYADLKQLARTGMEHDFLPGKSLWAEPDRFTTPASECRGGLGLDKPSTACGKFLEANQKAAAQYELERRFRAFESKF